jgi:O-antigen ligase
MLNKNKKQIYYFILANIFLLNISVAAISNYSLNIFIVKIVLSAALLIIIIVDVKLNKFDISVIAKKNNPKKMFLIIGLFTGYLGITLIYSDNPAYGAQKILNFLVSTFPSIVAVYYLIVTLSRERFKIIIIALVTITLLTVTYILFDYPFDQASVYEYTAGRWSHVIYGRFMGSIAVVFLLYTMWIIERHKTGVERWRVLLLVFINSLAVYGLYLSSLRSAMLGVILYIVLSALFIIFKIIVEREMVDVRRRQIASLVTVVILVIFFILLVPKPEIIETRFDNLTNIEDLEFGGDEPITSRIEALRISKKIFLEHPQFGTGFGGFRSYNNFTEFIKYPHNLFVEMAVEGGVLGLLILCALFLVIFKYTYSYSMLTFTFLLFAFWLAMFSKELSNQSLLWLFLAFTGINLKANKNRISNRSVK